MPERFENRSFVFKFWPVPERVRVSHRESLDLGIVVCSKVCNGEPYGTKVLPID